MDSCFWRSVLQQVLYQIRWNAVKVVLKIYTYELKFLLNFFLWTHFFTLEKKRWWNMNFRRNNTSIFTSTRLVFNSKCLFKGGRKGLVMGCMWLRRRHLRIAPIQERLDGASDSAEASCDARSQPHDITVYNQCNQQTGNLLFAFLIPTAPKRPLMYWNLKTAFDLIRFIIWCFCLRNIQDIYHWDVC